MTRTLVKLNAEQIEHIVDRVVPLISKSEDHDFFRGVLFLKLESFATSVEASLFVSNLLGQNA